MLFVDPSPDGAKADELTVFALWTGFAAQYPNCYALLGNRIAPIIHGMRTDFPYADGAFERASPFKKAANFTCYWVAAQPIVSHSDADVPSQKDINAMFAFTVSMRSLHNAKLLVMKKNRPESL